MARELSSTAKGENVNGTSLWQHAFACMAMRMFASLLRDGEDGSKRRRRRCPAEPICNRVRRQIARPLKQTMANPLAIWRSERRIRACSAISAVLRIAVGTVCVVAGLQHLGNQYAFAAAIAGYGLLSQRATALVAAYLPFVQLFTGVALIFHCATRGALYLAGVMFLAFAAAQSIALLRGRVIPCGCFGYSLRHVSMSTVAEAVFLSSLAFGSLFLGGGDDASGHKGPRASNERRSIIFRRSGLSLMEALVVVAIIGLLLAIVLPAVQSSREVARASDCCTRLQQLTTAVLQYESARRYLPPGILGVAEPFPFEGNYFNEDSSRFWKRCQYSSWLVLSADFWQEAKLTAQCHPVTTDVMQTLATVSSAPGSAAKFRWFGDVPGFRENATQQPALLRCPSDDPSWQSIPYQMGALQPVTDGPNQIDSIAWVNVLEHLTMPVGMTNYVGCLGAHSGGDAREVELRRFTGLMSSRALVRLLQARDGCSNTILLGEALGGIDGGVRSIVQSWFVGGLARGRADVPWRTAPSGHDTLLGNVRQTSWLGFSSAHPAAVAISLADGHVAWLGRATDWKVIYAMCGANDGFRPETDGI